jgi:hypothetical protein
MGAVVFSETVTGSTLDEAFRKAKDEAEKMYGSIGYSGIAAKPDVILMEDFELAWREAAEHADWLIASADPRIDDKWGPAGALRLHPIDGKPAWLIFGWTPC